MSTLLQLGACLMSQPTSTAASRRCKATHVSGMGCCNACNSVCTCDTYCKNPFSTFIVRMSYIEVAFLFSSKTIRKYWFFPSVFVCFTAVSTFVCVHVCAFSEPACIYLCTYISQVCVCVFVWVHEQCFGLQRSALEAAGDADILDR